MNNNRFLSMSSNSPSWFRICGFLPTLFSYVLCYFIVYHKNKLFIIRVQIPIQLITQVRHHTGDLPKGFYHYFDVLCLLLILLFHDCQELISKAKQFSSHSCCNLFAFMWMSTFCNLQGPTSCFSSVEILNLILKSC